jgi:hypothetical protein
MKYFITIYILERLNPVSIMAQSHHGDHQPLLIHIGSKLPVMRKEVVILTNTLFLMKKWRSYHLLQTLPRVFRTNQKRLLLHLHPKNT